ncbi:MAG TPA: hypothetical protein VFR03_15100 [Thermoanaerobaculia bacterium]|nr:hypothetical protein [Thermoanaerobaculia bacterium]
MIRILAVLLPGLLLVPGLSDAGKLRIGRVRIGVDIDSPSKKWAVALVPQIKAVRTRFDDSRRALQAVKGSDGKPAYLRKDVADLIDHTGKDLDDAIVKVQPSDLQALQDWAADELGRIQAELPPAQKTAAVPAGFFAPQPVAVVASLGSPKKPPSPKKPAGSKPKPTAPAAPPPDTVPAGKADGLLDEVGKVVDRILFLASHDDLQMKLWVGSTAPHVTFSFWPQGKVKGATPAPAIIRTDGKRGGVLRGLYVYRATWTQGKVTQVIEYPPPAGTQATLSERLDLVNGTGFFCCRFNEQYCYAVKNEKECR